jgi:hypothetical protein
MRLEEASQRILGVNATPQQLLANGRLASGFETSRKEPSTGFSTTKNTKQTEP